MKQTLVSVFLCRHIIWCGGTGIRKGMDSRRGAGPVDSFNEDKGKSYRVSSSPDGTMLHQNKKRTKEITWEIGSRGRHCAHFNKKKCGKIVSVGDGVYHKMKGDEHTHTLKNFVDGNRL